MGVLLRNLQNVVPLRRARLRKDVETLRHILGIQKFDLGLICVDNARIQRINNVYRKKNVPTDVLSFPFYEVVTAHGICHLLGYRHDTAEEWNEMLRKESYILSEFNRLTGSHLEPLTKKCTRDV
ncbi:endoribonuclease YbeY isoform X2 [Chanos chanos]|uniref:Endoribonuclease YbeY isoform X2 n=1 Tax=Chanos chanos TaxID=29144 RepID=A0A6J2WD18_CHACN|nr:endoribonuclease YbeY isoform X2 [Chanos chanos]